MNKKVFVLQRAKELIANGTESFLCLALTAAAPRDDVEAVQASKFLRELIMSEIGKDGKNVLSVDTWLRNHSPEFRAWRDKLNGIDAGNIFMMDEYIEAMKQYRLRWADALIAEFK